MQVKYIRQCLTLSGAQLMFASEFTRCLSINILQYYHLIPFPKIILLVILIINTYLYSTDVSKLFHKGLNSKYFRPVGHTISVANI